jgi:multiple sugar transport system permease protein
VTAPGQAIFRDVPEPPRQRVGLGQKVWNHRNDYFYVAPAIVVMLIVIAYPIYYTIELSFFDTPASLSLANKQFNGLDNYIAILTSPIFWKVSWQTLVWTVLSTFFAFVLGLGAALNRSTSSTTPTPRSTRSSS